MMRGAAAPRTLTQAQLREQTRVVIDGSSVENSV
jgi:hypothetical protein